MQAAQFKGTRSNGVSIPGDVGYPRFTWGSGSEKVTGINQNMQGQAQIAIDMLIGQIYRKSFRVPTHPIIATDSGIWHVGATTRRPRRGHKVTYLDDERLSHNICEQA